MRFQIKGMRKTAEVVSLVLDAPSPTDALRLAEHQGLKVLSLRAERRWSPARWRRREAFPLVLFSQELTTLLNAGLALIDALESLAEKESDAQARKILSDLVRLLYEGKSLSQALGEFPSIFPPLYVALVQSSEKTGAVGDALGRYVAYRTRMDEVRQKIVSASVYPLLLLLVGNGVLLFLIGYVVPRFSLVFEGLGSNLPWLSQVLLSVGQFIHTHQNALLGSLLPVLAALVVLLRQERVRRALGRLVEKVPTIRERLFIYEMARFYRSLGILLQGGIPILTALGMVRGLLGPASRVRLDRAGELIREGHALSRSLEENRLATPVSLRMLRAGEQAGNLGVMMERTADFYDEETGRWIDWFVRLFEPLLMTFIGLVIGVIVILMYMPIFELASSIQ
ncbi:type II secretion system F family protein [Azotobacter chroococcum]|uniref:Type II secretion system protein F n=2 Tax=Azotobacter chroococcum TaxID=353 RepID=A0A0C4WP82_9GAMM|nr:type II secretion system F family protein [Azotobacter chroococcum]AJE21370.1 Type II secretion system protein F [Azotobacter chroococcum NCIMB 8003]ASL26732.1 type II secretion system protein [Azotobacter chroococcum]QQE87040.1 type II secretion system F family protein [Azotobacter chroococcum]TKD31641.1 type II secretion system F family protein [Azotobacter chroococcum]